MTVTKMKGAFHTMRAAVPHMIEQGFGSIFNCSSDAWVGLPGNDPDLRLLAVVEADHGDPANLGPVFAYLSTKEAGCISGEVFGLKSSGKIDRYAYPAPISHAERPADGGFLWQVDELSAVFRDTVMGEGYESHAAKRAWA